MSKEKRHTIPQTIKNLMEAEKVNQVQLSYHGSGDDGQTETVTDRNGNEVSGDLDQAVQDFFEELGINYSDNDGGSGTLTIDSEYGGLLEDTDGADNKTTYRAYLWEGHKKIELPKSDSVKDIDFCNHRIGVQLTPNLTILSPFAQAFYKTPKKGVYNLKPGWNESILFSGQSTFGDIYAAIISNPNDVPEETLAALIQNCSNVPQLELMLKACEFHFCNNRNTKGIQMMERAGWALNPMSIALCL